ncbi:solute carrier family 15 member 4-like [Corticium candelabrum]|uniref:solute carrier family 15 member 4-like n=1 Tax=Corticium candelabrum TaxID=121492 RepID=UPI002E3615D0|nr:solute carrier family 15 member 4-like [Corticium candelabrum]
MDVSLSQTNLRRNMREALVGGNRERRCSVNLTDSTKSLIRLLVVLVLERVAFHFITDTIDSFTYFYLNFSFPSSTTTYLIFSGSALLLAPFFGVLTDRKTGCMPTLITAFAFYLIGSSLLLTCTIQTVIHSGTKPSGSHLNVMRTLYIVGLIIVTLSRSAVRAALMPCMVEQLSDGHAKRSTLIAFCSWAFVGINVGSVLAIVPGGYLAITGAFTIDGHLYSSGFFWLSLATCCVLLLAFVILIIWRKTYKSPCPRQRLDEATVPSLPDILKTACGCYRDSSRPAYYDPDALPIRNKEDRLQYEASIERKKLALLVPALSTMIVFFASYMQLEGSYKVQALHLDLTFTTAKEASGNCSIVSNEVVFLIRPSIAQALTAACVLLTLAAVPTVIRPCYEKRFKKELKMMTRIQWGMSVSVLGSTCAMILEIVRYHSTPIKAFCLTIGGKSFVFAYSSISALWQIPQYCLLGMSAAFCVVAAAEFVLSRAPSRFRCTAFGCFWLAWGLGHYVGLAIYYTMSRAKLYYSETSHTKQGTGIDIGALTNQETECNPWAYYFAFTFLSITNLVAFTLVKRRHRDIQTIDRPHRSVQLTAVCM